MSKKQTEILKEYLQYLDENDNVYRRERLTDSENLHYIQQFVKQRKDFMQKFFEGYDISLAQKEKLLTALCFVRREYTKFTDEQLKSLKEVENIKQQCQDFAEKYYILKASLITCKGESND